MSNTENRLKRHDDSKKTVRRQQELNDFVAHLIHNFTLSDIAEMNGISRQQQHNRINKFKKEVAK
jgi:predicted DNA-binding protein YlxM (UPF0122 family)